MAIILAFIAGALYVGNLNYLRQLPSLLRFWKTEGRVLSIEH